MAGRAVGRQGRARPIFVVRRVRGSVADYFATERSLLSWAEVPCPLDFGSPAGR